MFQNVPSFKQKMFAKSPTLGVTNDEEKILGKLKKYTFDLIKKLAEKVTCAKLSNLQAPSFRCKLMLTK